MRTTYPTYYDEAVGTDYPFESGAVRSSGDVVIENDVFVDGRLFPPAGRHDLFISTIAVGEIVEIVLSDGAGEVGRGEFVRSSPPNYVTFASGSTYLGILQASVIGGLSKLAGWPDGSYVFRADQTRFAATVVVPQPQVGVREFVLESGAVFSGDVVAVGERGVQLTMRRSEGSSSSGDGMVPYSDYDRETIRVDVVGDPLAARRACEGYDYDRDVVVTAINVGGVVFEPDETGGMLLTIAHTTGARPALRLLPVPGGMSIGFVGS